MNKEFKAKLDTFRHEGDSRFLTARLVVSHDGLNFNGSDFTKEDMLRCAEATLRESPILGSVVVDEETGEKRLNGHDMDYILVEKDGEYDVEIKHIERIYGFIPHDAPIKMEFRDDKYYLITTCVLWRNYLDDLEDILFNQDGECEVSMEIECLESHINSDGNLQITDFIFLGISMLGVEPAMKGANLKLSNFSMKNIKSELQEMMKAYALEKGGEIMEEKKTVELEKNEPDEVVQDIDETIETNPEVAEEVSEVEQSESTEFKLDEEEKDDEEDEEFKCGGSNDKKKKTYEELESELNVLQESYSELKAQLDSMSDYADLKAFKESYDNAKYESEIEEISNMFSLDIEEYSDLKEKVLSKEISKEQYQEKLALKQFMKEKHEKFEKKFEKESSSSEIKIINDDIEKENLPYNGEFEKYLRR